MSPAHRITALALAVLTGVLLAACGVAAPRAEDSLPSVTDDSSGWHDFKPMESALASAVAQPGIATESFDGLEAVAREWLYFGIFPHIVDEVGIDEVERIAVAEAISVGGNWSVRQYRLTDGRKGWSRAPLEAAKASGLDEAGAAWAAQSRGGVDVLVKRSPGFEPALTVVFVHGNDIWELEGPEEIPVDAIIAGIAGS